MSIDSKTVAKLEKLSMFKFDESKHAQVTENLENILEFVSQLQEVNTDGVEPMSSTVSAESTPERTDEVTFENDRDNLLSVTKNQEMGFFVVPRVVE